MISRIRLTQTILYVSDQQASCAFYEKLLRVKADLDVPGMTEFRISDSCRLGLMPESGIAKLLGDKMPAPASGNGIPRCELYFYVDNVEAELENAMGAGARLISGAEERDWGDLACYVSDPDGHVIAFARKPDRPKLV